MKLERKAHGSLQRGWKVIVELISVSFSFLKLKRLDSPRESRLDGSNEGQYQLEANSFLSKISQTQTHRFHKEIISSSFHPFGNLDTFLRFSGHLLRQQDKKFKIHFAQLRLPQPLCSVQKSCQFLLPHCCNNTG